MSRIRGRCRLCRFEFDLAQLVRSPFLEGHCPYCGQPLAADTRRMLKAAARTMIAHDEFLQSVRDLADLPGNLVLVPHTLVREVLEEIDWEEKLVEDRELVRREIEELERYAKAWAKLAGAEERAQRSELRAGLGRLALHLRQLAGRLEGRPGVTGETSEAPAPAGDATAPTRSKEARAAEAVAAQADALAESMSKARPAEGDVMETLNSARQSLDGPAEDDRREST